MSNKKFASHAFIGIDEHTGGVDINCSCTNDELMLRLRYTQKKLGTSV